MLTLPEKDTLSADRLLPPIETLSLGEASILENVTEMEVDELEMDTFIGSKAEPKPTPKPAPAPKPDPQSKSDDAQGDISSSFSFNSRNGQASAVPISF